MRRGDGGEDRARVRAVVNKMRRPVLVGPVWGIVGKERFLWWRGGGSLRSWRERNWVCAKQRSTSRRQPPVSGDESLVRRGSVWVESGAHLVGVQARGHRSDAKRQEIVGRERSPLCRCAK